MKFPLRLVQVIKDNLNPGASAPAQAPAAPQKLAVVEKDEEMIGYEEEIKTNKDKLPLKKDLSEKTSRLEKLGAALGKLFDGKTDVKDTRETILKSTMQATKAKTSVRLIYTDSCSQFGWFILCLV